MNDFQAAQLDPFAPRQCAHWNSDGIQCRAYARHNEYTCFQHRVPDEPSIPIIANDPFTLPPLHTRSAILDALTAVANLLAGKRIDDRRAKLLLYTIQLASNQLPRPTAVEPTTQSGAPFATASSSRVGSDSSSGLSTSPQERASAPGVHASDESLTLHAVAETTSRDQLAGNPTGPWHLATGNSKKPAPAFKSPTAGSFPNAANLPECPASSYPPRSPT